MNIPWEYKGEIISTPPTNGQNFVYELTFESGKKYIGKKAFYSITTKKAKKSGVPRMGSVRIKKIKYYDEDGKSITKTRAKVLGIKGVLEPFDLLSSESDWRNYTGSIRLLEDPNLIRKEILYVTKNEVSATYLELKEIILKDALFSREYLNANILGKFYKSVEQGFI